jgi:8-oxo-dGTP pyrophosphatase MutT (NUDIX family)
MKSQLQKTLHILISKSNLNVKTKKKFLSRIQEGNLTRDENPTSHFCVYFAAYDAEQKKVFLGKHIKSGLWLFNGGHIDKGESLESALHREIQEEWGLTIQKQIASPSFFTITQIENPKKQVCQVHFDIWYFIPLSADKFHPLTSCLSSEFYEWGWKTLAEVDRLVKNTAVHQGIKKIRSFF